STFQDHWASVRRDRGLPDTRHRPAGATPPPATPTSWPRGDANAPASAANASNAGADPEPPTGRLLEQRKPTRQTYPVTALVGLMVKRCKARQGVLGYM